MVISEHDCHISSHVLTLLTTRQAAAEHQIGYLRGIKFWDLS
ncbi:hypothetical protein Pd630_LPD13042 (plasmid) [Rhodococcus opacus PD630]|nr:hypothetical protein Pd630_LPD13042 [Rhodococcus opacus PD630]